jgi:hypothetical protein
MPIQEDSHCRESIQSSEDCALDVAIEKDTVVSSSAVIQARMLPEFDKEILMVLPLGFC